MRYYGFGSYYLSSLQQGLQAAHVIADMGAYHRVHHGSPFDEHGVQEAVMFYEWAEDHKTIILLNGGNSADLVELHTFLQNGRGQHSFPFSIFHEDEISLNKAATSVGIVLPPKIYETAEMDRSKGWNIDGDKPYTRPKLNGWEEELIIRLNRCGLAK